MNKNIYRKEDIPIADYLMSFRQALTDDFLNYHRDFDAEFAKATKAEPIYNVENFINWPGAWTGTGIKYVFGPRRDLIPPEIRKYFRTAIALTNEFAKDCPISSYSVLEPGGIIHRHTGPENRHGDFVRIHIPLIVPEGDIFFEVGGEVVLWDDIFAFNNQTVHSAYNFSNKRRLVFLIDIRRSRIGMERGRPYDKVRDEDAYPPFDPTPYRSAA